MLKQYIHKTFVLNGIAISAFFLVQLGFAQLSLAEQSYAQDSNEQISTEEPAQQWYQVEVVIFASNDMESGLDERWPEELGLQYPANSTHISPSLDRIEPTLTAEENLADTAFISTETNQPQASEAAPALTHQTQPLIAFSQLQADQLELNEAATNIAKQYDFRPLFHKAWSQTINNRENATSIIITGGEAYDDHFELEGSIKISVERYLHINTDLWLNQFVSKAGQEQPSWPVLPAIPAQIIETNSSELLLGDSTMLRESEQATNDSNLVLADAIEQPPAIDLLSEANLALEQQLTLLTESQYAVEKTVVMRQHRRMRSKELHYIDHPLFGMLIKIVPYELPEELNEKQAEG